MTMLMAVIEWTSGRPKKRLNAPWAPTAFAVKVIAKIVGVLPLARAFKFGQRDANYLTLMMATGLTFGTISSLYGLTHHYINQSQYTALVTVVILTALVPTIVAQALFKPKDDPQEMESEVP